LKDTIEGFAALLEGKGSFGRKRRRLSRSRILYARYSIVSIRRRKKISVTSWKEMMKNKY